MIIAHNMHHTIFLISLSLSILLMNTLDNLGVIDLIDKYIENKVNTFIDWILNYFDIFSCDENIDDIIHNDYMYDYELMKQSKQELHEELIFKTTYVVI